MRYFFLIFLLNFSLFAKTITPSDVYAQAMLITDETHALLKYYNIEHDHDGIMARTGIKTQLKPRNSWQMTYEIALKINIFRTVHKLPIIQPVNIAPVLDLNADLVYEQTQRILTEIKIFKYKMGIEHNESKAKEYANKTPLDVFNLLRKISASFDELNQAEFTSSYVFAETMRIYDDLTIILAHLKIKDNTVPPSSNPKITSKDAFDTSMEALRVLKQIQFTMGIDGVDFSAFNKQEISANDMFTISQMIIAELQTIKAYIGLKHYITPAAGIYRDKTPANVEQLMNWNLRKISLIYESRKNR